MSVRTNHVHCVVVGIASPERILNDLKAWATRALREAELVPPDVSPWSRHGSTRYLWTEASVDTAIRYVEEFKDHRDPLADPAP